MTVAIADANGQPIEAGAGVATPPKSGRWQYTATQNVPTGTSVKITVTATDRPGHTATQEESHG